MAQRFLEEVREETGVNEDLIELREYLEAIRRSWEEHEEFLIAKIPRFLDLKKDERLTNSHINLCSKCLMVYPDEDLEKVGTLLYCKVTKENPDGCFPEASISSSEETSPSKKGKEEEEKVEEKEEVSQAQAWYDQAERLRDHPDWWEY